MDTLEIIIRSLIQPAGYPPNPPISHEPWNSSTDSSALNSLVIDSSLYPAPPKHRFFFKINLFIYLFIGCVGSPLLRAGFLSLRRAGATLLCGARASHRGGFSCCGAQALGTRASAVVAHGLSSCGSRALERRLSSCGARA